MLSALSYDIRGKIPFDPNIIIENRKNIGIYEL